MNGLKRILISSLFMALALSLGAPDSAIAQQEMAPRTKFDDYSDMGIAAFKRGREQEAETYLRSALQLAESFPQNDPRLIKTLRNLAMVLASEEKFAEAEQVQRREIELKEKTFGDSQDLASSLNNLGVLCFNQGKYKEGEVAYKRVISIDEKILPRNHPERILSMENYAKLLRRMNRYKEAEQYDSLVEAIE